MKDKITKEIAKDYFNNPISVSDARVVEETLNGVIGDLIAKNKTAGGIAYGMS